MQKKLEQGDRSDKHINRTQPDTTSTSYTRIVEEQAIFPCITLPNKLKKKLLINLVDKKSFLTDLDSISFTLYLPSGSILHASECLLYLGIEEQV